MEPPRDLQSLLAWSTSQTPVNYETPPARQPTERLDPGLIDALLGRTDAVRMRECVAISSDMAKPLEARMTAWDELEMILESLDNANDLQPLGLWPDIVGHFTSPEDETIVQALWVCGTAINNNPKARDDFLRQDPLPMLISLFRASSANPAVRSKALYCLGGTLKHHLPSIQRFTELEGWTALEDSLRDPSLPCRRKGAFLVGSLLTDTVSQEATREAILAKTAIVPALIDSLSPSTAQPLGVDGDDEGFDEDVAESSMRALRSLAGHLQRLEASRIVEVVNTATSEFGLTKEEKSEFLASLSA